MQQNIATNLRCELTTRTADTDDAKPAEKVNYFWRLHIRLNQRLPMWVVYRPVTREYPGQWCARMHVTLPVSKPTRFVIVADTLEAVRQLLPGGLTNMCRYPEDVPEIEEVWL